MAPADDNETSDDLDDENQGPTSKEDKQKSARKKLLLLASCLLMALVLAGGGLAYFMGWLNPLLGIEEQHKVVEVELGAPVTHAFPQIKADLKTAACRAPFLRISISVQLSETDLKRLENAQEKILDQIISHLRDQERQDLVGKAGSDKLRFDLVNIINHAIKPTRIHSVIFKEFVLQ